MKTSKPLTKTKEAVGMSNATKKELDSVAQLFKGKEMFPGQLERAKQMFKGLQSFPA